MKAVARRIRRGRRGSGSVGRRDTGHATEKEMWLYKNCFYTEGNFDNSCATILDLPDVYFVSEGTRVRLCIE